MRGLYSVGDKLAFFWPHGTPSSALGVMRRDNGTLMPLNPSEAYAEVLEVRYGVYVIEVHSGVSVIRSGEPQPIVETFTVSWRWASEHVYLPEPEEDTDG